MKLSTLSVLLGLVMAAPQVYGLVNPAGFRDRLRRFPRSEWCGYFLVALGTAWFLWLIKQETNEDFAAYKKVMYPAFGLLGVFTCIFVRDYLAVRGLAVVFLLLAKLMVDTARWADTPWRLVIIIWAYVLIFAGMWFTISPWRLRDLIHWFTDGDRRVRVGSAVRLSFALLVIALGLTVF